MEQITKLTSIITENEEKIIQLQSKANKYENKCFELIEELDKKKKMLEDIYKIIKRSEKKNKTDI